MIADLRYGLRQLRRSPLFTLMAVLTLGAGIGANIALFSLLSAMIFRPVPGIRSDGQLVWLAATRDGNSHPSPLSYPAFKAFTADTAIFESAGVFAGTELQLSDGGEPTRVRGQIVSSGYWIALGPHMSVGRPFGAEGDEVDAPARLAVIGYNLWQNRFQGSPAIIGRVIKLEGIPCTVVGVAAPGFNGPDIGDATVDVWLPINMQPFVAPDLSLKNPNAWWLSALAKLRPNVSESRAGAAVELAARRFAKPGTAKADQAGGSVFTMHGGVQPGDLSSIVPAGALGAAASLLILLVCCANVANMLLVRAANRRREIAIRLSIGASRGRLVRQLLSESLLLALAASALGLAIGLAGTRAVAQSLLPTIDVSLTPTVVLFSVAIAALAAVAFGLLPALHATSGSLSAALTAASGAIAGGRSRLQSAFVVAQVALSLVLLSTAAMFLDGLYRATRVDLGFAADAHTLAASVALPAARYDSTASRAFVTSITARLAATPGVVSAAAATAVPLGERRILGQIALSTGPADRTLPASYVNDVTPSFFAALDLPVLSGTVFDAGDASAAVVSQDFARRVWPNEDALGKLVSVSGPKGPFLRVVGVARSALVYGAGEQSRPVVYRTLSANSAARQITFVVRGTGDGNTLAPVLRQVVREADPSLAPFGVETLAQYRADRLEPVKYGSAALLIVGALGALLACLGVFAVVAFSVSTRAREIGIRMALGANHGNVVRLFVSEGMRLGGIGIIVGLALSTALGVAVRSAFTGVSPNQLSSFAATGALIVIVTGLATWLPARRAATIDPMRALRSD